MNSGLIAKKEKVLEYYEKHKRLVSPIFWVVKMTKNTLQHLDMKDRNHARSEQEKSVRYDCFLYIHYIVENSHLAQEWKIWQQYEVVKKFGKKEKQMLKVEHFWLVWIVNQSDWYKTRIKVVIKKVYGRNHAEVISVIPARNSKWYTKMFFEETKKPN